MIPSVRPTVPTSIDHYFQATFVLRYFEKWEWTYGQTYTDGNMCEKMITTGLDCGAAEWIKTKIRIPVEEIFIKEWEVWKKVLMKGNDFPKEVAWLALC